MERKWKMRQGQPGLLGTPGSSSATDVARQLPRTDFSGSMFFLHPPSIEGETETNSFSHADICRLSTVSQHWRVQGGKDQSFAFQRGNLGNSKHRDM